MHCQRQLCLPKPPPDAQAFQCFLKGLEPEKGRVNAAIRTTFKLTLISPSSIPSVTRNSSGGCMPNLRPSPFPCRKLMRVQAREATICNSSCCPSFPRVGASLEMSLRSGSSNPSTTRRAFARLGPPSVSGAFHVSAQRQRISCWSLRVPPTTFLTVS